jgi:hypothetical protein
MDRTVQGGAPLERGNIYTSNQTARARRVAA